ncbi:hypothetical protein Pcinc_014029 [Petrolisthes cinctipes]|uniref:Uncharacterized protein n=1 Tax=Petrolisthes cinctipes TaxID=88211 RepID=A0AAE1FVN6_PETCI|nr:hypothetical protein Pcinc_014029 [Petrolisthes cinctipes]
MDTHTSSPHPHSYILPSPTLIHPPFPHTHTSSISPHSYIFLSPTSTHAPLNHIHTSHSPSHHYIPSSLYISLIPNTPQSSPYISLIPHTPQSSPYIFLIPPLPYIPLHPHPEPCVLVRIRVSLRKDSSYLLSSALMFRVFRSIVKPLAQTRKQKSVKHEKFDS